MSARAEEHWRVLEQIPAADVTNDTLAIHAMKGQQLSDHDRKALDTLLEQGRIDLSITPRGGETDRSISLGITKELMEKIDYAPLFVNGRNPNASFSSGSPDVIQLRDELLREKGVDLTAFHEGTHLIDRDCELTSGTRLSGAEFKEQHEHLARNDPQFFLDLNEKSFMPDLTGGGHAQDNEFELLSSFANSFNAPNWEERMMEKALAFKVNYAQTLIYLKASLERQQHIPKDAPIYAEIDRCLEAMLGESLPPKTATGS